MPSTTPTLISDLAGTTLQNGRFRLEKCIGTGAYATVYKAVDTSNQQESGSGSVCAIKCMMEAPVGSSDERFQQLEVSLLGRVSKHENVVQMREHFYESGMLFIVLEFCDGGNLVDSAQRGEYLDKPDRIRAIVLQLLDGLEHCHANGVFHRDIKLENVLCTSDGTVKLCDFGLATEDVMSDTFCIGTMACISPECLGEFDEVPYSSALNDVWALGIIIITMVLKELPWLEACESDKSYRHYTYDEDYFRRAFGIPVELNELVKGMLSIDPAERLSLAEVRVLVEATPDLFFPSGRRGSEDTLVADPGAKGSPSAKKMGAGKEPKKRSALSRLRRAIAVRFSRK